MSVGNNIATEATYRGTGRSRTVILPVAKTGGPGTLHAMSVKTKPPQDEAAEEPHYHGHRDRLRERFYSAGPDALSDYELLEMALFAAIPRRDTKPLAKALIRKFGSFAEVIHAPEARLREVDGIKDASVNQLKLIAAAARRIATGEIKS